MRNGKIIRTSREVRLTLPRLACAMLCLPIYGSVAPILSPSKTLMYLQTSPVSFVRSCLDTPFFAKV